MIGDKFNLGDLMKNVKKVQEMMEKAQEELAKIEIIGESGAGAVKVIMNARHFVKKIEIDDELLKESKAILEDLLAAAINDAVKKVEEITKRGVSDMLGSLSDKE